MQDVGGHHARVHGLAAALRTREENGTEKWEQGLMRVLVVIEKVYGHPAT